MPYVLQKLAALTPGEWTDLLRAQVALLRAQRLVRTRPSGHLVTEAGGRAPGRASAPVPARVRPPDEWQAAERLAVAVARAAGHGIIRPRCLVRATALQQLLERRGIAGSRLCVGVRREGAALAAHAWVELDGRVLCDREEHVRTFAHLADLRIATPR